MKPPLAATALALLLSGCAAIQPAHPVLDGPLQAAPAQRFAGAGFGQRGAFALAGHQIRFERSRDRLDLGHLQRATGALRLTIDGPDLSVPLQVDCRAEERTASLALFSVEVEPMALRCHFLSEGRSIPARLEVQTVRPDRLVAVHERRGEIALDRVILSIRSLHRLEGAKVPTDLPIGYAFYRGGQPVAAVEANGVPVVRLAGSLDTPDTRAAVVAAAVLGLLWDPAED